MQPKLIDRVYIRSTRTLLTALVSSAFVLRAILSLVNFRGNTIGTTNFLAFGAEMGWVARSIATGHGFSSPFWPVTGPTALVPPLFPYLLAGVFKVFGLYTVRSSLAILLIESLVSALTCIPIYLIVKESVGERTAQLAAWLWVIYPFSIFFCSGAIWDYAQTSFLFALCFYFAQHLPSKKLLGWFGFGILYGITALSNPSVLSLLPFLLLIALWNSRRKNWFLRGAVTTIAFFLVITPWSIRNHRVLHALVPIRDGFWLEFWAGNNDNTSDSNPIAAHPPTSAVEMQLYRSQGEIAYIAGKHSLAVNFVHRHPVYFLDLCLHRAFLYWTGLWSLSPRSLRDQILDPTNLFCICTTLFMLRGLRRWWAAAPGNALPYLIVILLFPIPYYLSHASMAYRQPIEPQIIILAAIGIFGLGKSSTASLG